MLSLCLGVRLGTQPLPAERSRAGPLPRRPGPGLPALLRPPGRLPRPQLDPLVRAVLFRLQPPGRPVPPLQRPQRRLPLRQLSPRLLPQRPRKLRPRQRELRLPQQLRRKLPHLPQRRGPRPRQVLPQRPDRRQRRLLSRARGRPADDHSRRVQPPPLRDLRQPARRMREVPLRLPLRIPWTLWPLIRFNYFFVQH
jgi:hypothetical protein